LRSRVREETGRETPSSDGARPWLARVATYSAEVWTGFKIRFHRLTKGEAE